MKRFWTSLATFSLAETIGRHPAIAGILMLLGVGGGAGIANLITPAAIPQPAAYFNQNQSIGTTNNGLLPNQGTGGSSYLPSDAAASFGYYFEANVDANLGFGSSVIESMGGIGLSGNEAPGLPAFSFQHLFSGISGTQWWNAPGPATTSSASVTTGGSSYNGGFFPVTFTGGECLREPTGVWEGASLQIVDPGFGCGTSPTLSAATIPNAGAQQTGVTATCAASPVFGQMLVTTSLSVSPGLTPGMTYSLSGFTTSGGTSINTTFTTTSVTGSGPYTLIGTATGTCPTISSTGTALSGSGATFAFPTISTSNPFTGMTGVTAKNGQHVCGFLGEYGDDSPFPGAAFLSMVDDKGNALPGSPALVPYLNQNTFNAAGYITAGTQSPSSPALTITSMTAYTITGATYSATTGYVTFTTSASTGLAPGSEFTVSGMNSTGASINLTYVAVNPSNLTPSAYQTGTTIVGNPLSGPAGTLQAITNPGTITTGSSPQMVSVIMPGAQLLGNAIGGVVLPYGVFGATGTGEVGTYALASNPGSYTFTVSAVNTGTPSITVSTNPSIDIVPGTTFTLNSNTYVVTSLGTGTGGTGTYNVNTGTGLATGTATASGAVGSSGTPVTIFGYGLYYFGATPSTNSWLGTISTRTASSLGDFIGLIGTGNTALSGTTRIGWGGSIGNLAMLYGVVPQQTGGSPSTNSLASLCKKTTDIQSFATANSMTVKSLYRLNDIGMFGDSGKADFTGSISGAALTIASTQTGSTASLPSGTIISGVGITGCPSSCPTISTGSGTSYTLNTSGGTVSSEPMKAGAFAPMKPLQANTFTGYIDNGSGSTPTLHVTALPTSPSGAAATFTGTLGTSFTANISGSTLTEVGPGDGGVGQPVIGIGMTVNIPGGTPSSATVTGFGTGVGWNGTYTLNTTVTGAGSNEVMFGSGQLPGPPTTLQVSGVTGTIQQGMYVTDGGASLTGSPLIITGGSGTVWTVAGNYYPSITSDTTMVASLSSVVPGEYIQNASISSPVKVIGYQGPCGITGAIASNNGGLGCYTLSASPNATGLVGSSGAQVTLTGTSISDGGAIAPGPALTVRDQGPGIIFPVTPSTISCTGYGSCTGTGTLFLSGTYDTSALGGAPSTIQAQVSLSAGGPPVPGCSTCTWTNLASYSAALSSGTVYNWSGQALTIPAGGPYFVSVRAANGTAYATLPNSIKIGNVHDLYGQGQAAALPSSQGGVSWSYFTGNWGLVANHSPFPFNESFLLGPPVSGQFVPSASTSVAGDRFGVVGGGLPLSEGVGNFEQLLSDAFGWPVSFINNTHDGVGILLQTLGNVTQTQTVGVGNGTATTWCSASKFCANVGQGGPLTFSAASLTGAQFTGTITTPGSSGGASTLQVGTGSPAWTSGALEPGMALNLPGSPTLINCVSSCGSASSIIGSGSVWALSAAPTSGTYTGAAMRADYPQGGGTPWPTFNVQTGGALPFNLLGYGSELIKAGTFSVSVNGTVVCQDTRTFAYNNTGGNCTGAGIASSFVNYQTGDYEITFSSAPTGPIVASWTNIISPENVLSTQFSRPQGIDYFGDGTAQSGFLSGMFNRTPGGVSGHINSGCSTDEGYILQSASPANQGYQFGAPGYSAMDSWLYGTKMPNLLSDMSAATPYIASLQYRGEGPTFFTGANNGGKLNICDQLGQDMSTKSAFSGHVVSTGGSGLGILTIDSSVTGPMWEGEVVGCAASVSSCPIPAGIFITSLTSGSWGALGSTYNLSVPTSASSISTSVGVSLQNAVYYSGSGPAIYGGALYDIIVQNQGLSGTTGYNPHMWLGFTGGRRVGARLAATIWGGMTNLANASPPSLDRVKADAAGCDNGALASPCFDVGNTYAASATPTGVSGAVLTFNGLSANARPIVVGQAVSCSGCATGLYVKSVSNPPTQSTVAGAGQIGPANNGFTVTLNASSGWTSGAVTFGCSGTAGTGSNCIDIAFSINTTNGTFRTAAALATCGADNLNGNAPNYAPPAGKCHDNGVGELTRGFRLGTAQAMYGIFSGGSIIYPNGSVFDDGVDFQGGLFNQSAAFTCNIVASQVGPGHAGVVQCVKGPVYTSGVPSGIGQWLSGSTFVNYGDMTLITGRIASVLGAVGGQSFPIGNAGSGYASGFYQGVQATCPTLASGGSAPFFDITVSGGAIVNVVPSGKSGTATQVPGLGVGSACTLTNTNFPSGMINGSGSGGSISIPLAPNEGQGGIATFNTDTNETGMFLYDNTGFVGNPLNPFFTNGQGGYFEPGLPVRPFGEFQGALVSG